jgi:hypothetical protein
LVEKNRQKKHRLDYLDCLHNTINLTKNELLKYSNFIEDDLNRFHCTTKSKVTRNLKSSNLKKSDIVTVKKILLEDYITEVREIILAEGCKVEGVHEAKILENVKKRMDVDMMEMKFSSPAGTCPEFQPSTLLTKSGSMCSFSSSYNSCNKKIVLCKSESAFNQNSRLSKCCYCRHQIDRQKLCKSGHEVRKSQLCHVVKPAKMCASCKIRTNLLERCSSCFKNKSKRHCFYYQCK